MVDGAAGDALTVRVLQGMLPLMVELVMTTVGVLQVMVRSVGPRVGGRRHAGRGPSPLLAEGPVDVAGR